MARSIAIVEDEPAIRDNYVDVLTHHGYKVDAYPNRPTALKAFEEELPELVIIDVGLEDEIEGGFDLCRELRGMSPTLPLIFLTARDSDFDVISGLRLGADDYLTKDISLPHLVARIVALFRRQDAMNVPENQDNTIRRGPLTLDTDRMVAYWNDEILTLTVTEFWLIHALARFPGHVKNRDQLMEEANVVVDDNTITSHIKRVRKKFMLIDESFDAIETVYGMGYRWLSNT